MYASNNGHLEVVKYLYETCHDDVETKDKDGCTPIRQKKKKSHLEIVKYLYETCQAKITSLVIEEAGTNEIKQYLISKK